MTWSAQDSGEIPIKKRLAPGRCLRTTCLNKASFGNPGLSSVDAGRTEHIEAALVNNCVTLLDLADSVAGFRQLLLYQQRAALNPQNSTLVGTAVQSNTI